MAYRLAIAFGVVLLATSPVLAQESGQELELPHRTPRAKGRLVSRKLIT